MKVPEFMFVVVNPVMKALLRSPLHGLASKDLAVVTFTGRKSGKTHSTPVRYLRYEDKLISFSSDDTLWWRNLRAGATATFLVQGKEVTCTTHVVENDVAEVRKWLSYYFDLHPGDAAYHDVKMSRDGTPDELDMVHACEHGVVVIAQP